MSEVTAGLTTAINGKVVGPDAPDYDESRSLFNAMIDRRPAAIAYCIDDADVARSVEYARREGLRLAVRCGAHNAGGLGSVDDGLVVDLSEMNAVEVDPAARTVRVQGGAKLSELDAATHEHGLAVPIGIIGSTGVGGLTLGGGTGHLSRFAGLTIDRLTAATVVLADGSIVQTDADREPDLFWAIRGGGGNFGIVTSFSFSCVPVKNIVGGPMFWPIERTEEILSWYRGFIGEQPSELGGFFNFHSVPPVDLFPAEYHLHKVCGVVWCCADVERADELLAPARALEPIIDGVAEMPLPALNTAFDGLYSAGDQWYWRATFIDSVPDEAVTANAKWGAKMPTWKSAVHIYPIDGAAARVGSEETAWAFRDAKWVQVIVGVDPDPANAPQLRDWAVGYSEAIEPYAMNGTYLNMIMDEGQERVQASYRQNYPRLAKLKATYDPQNLFNVNQNILPVG